MLNSFLINTTLQCSYVSVDRLSVYKILNCHLSTLIHTICNNKNIYIMNCIVLLEFSILYQYLMICFVHWRSLIEFGTSAHRQVCYCAIRFKFPDHTPNGVPGMLKFLDVLVFLYPLHFGAIKRSPSAPDNILGFHPHSQAS